MFSRRGQPLPIGIDLGHDSIKLAQMTLSPSGPKLLGTARESLSEEAKGNPDQRLQSALAVVRRLMTRKPFSGRRVIACLPREFVQLKNIRLPIMPDAEIAAAVEFEAANVFGLDQTSGIIRHIVAGEVRQGSDSRLEILCLGARREDVDGFVESFHQAGIDLCGLEFEPAALYRGVQRFLPGPSAASASVMLDIGYRRTQVMIGRGESVQFVKPIDIGSRRLHAAVSRKLAISEKEAASLRMEIDSAAPNNPIDPSVRQAVEDATRQTFNELIREVALCLRYFSVTFRGVRVQKLRVVGGEANCGLLRTILAQELSVPLDSTPVVESFAKAAAVNVAPWCLPIGLSLGASPRPADMQLGDPPAEAWDAAGQAEIEVLSA